MSENETTELVIERDFDAPRELVFRAWSEPQRLAQWWGPKGGALEVLRMEFAPGGEFVYAMTMPGTAQMWGKFVYREIAEPERLVFVNAFSDADGNVVRNPMSETWPLEILNTLTFTETAGVTTMRMSGGPLHPTAAELRTFEAALKSVQGGFQGTLDQLAEYLAGAQ